MLLEINKQTKRGWKFIQNITATYANWSIELISCKHSNFNEIPTVNTKCKLKGSVVWNLKPILPWYVNTSMPAISISGNWMAFVSNKILTYFKWRYFCGINFLCIFWEFHSFQENKYPWKMLNTFLLGNCKKTYQKRRF